MTIGQGLIERAGPTEAKLSSARLSVTESEANLAKARSSASLAKQEAEIALQHADNTLKNAQDKLNYARRRRLPIEEPKEGPVAVDRNLWGVSLYFNDLIDSWEATGVREFILLTAHGHDPHKEALATVISTAARVRVVDMFGVNLSDLLEGQREAMHGDEVDTSIMLFLCPEMVSLDQAQDYMMSREQLRRYRRGWLTVPSGSAGSIGRPSLASAEKGKRIYERIYSKISDRIFLAPSPTE